MAQTRGDGDETAADPRAELRARHADARRRRNQAPLGGHAWEQASADVGRIEVEMARLDREATPPRG